MITPLKRNPAALAARGASIRGPQGVQIGDVDSCVANPRQHRISCAGELCPAPTQHNAGALSLVLGSAETNS